MRTFTMYRRGDLSATHDANQANPPDMPQFQGVVFDNGQCVIRWLTQKGSVSVWDSFDDMDAIHGHPEYDSEIVWNAAEAERDEARRLLREVVKADRQDTQMGYPIPGDSCMGAFIGLVLMQYLDGLAAPTKERT